MKLVNRFLAVAAILGVLAVSRANAQTLTTLHSFSGPDGMLPTYLIDGGSGTFYGATEAGAAGFGRLYSVSSSGVFSNLYDFQGGNDGQTPDTLVLGDNGKLYGATDSGGSGGGGTLWDLTIGLDSGLTTIASFTTDTLGNALSPGIIKGIDGYFYGNYTRTDGPEYDTIFRLTESGTLTPLVTLNGFNGDNIASAVQVDTATIYGVTSAGGSTFGGLADTGFGTFSKYLVNQGTVTVLHSFNGTTDGSNPRSLIHGTDGNFYGLTTGSDGAHETDTFFKVTSSGTLTTLLTFDRSVGSHPNSMIQASDNNFYGTMAFGGPGYNGTSGGNGFIFKIDGSSFAFASVVTFNETNGQAPIFLVQASDGKLYGTTGLGGSGHSGTVFQLNGVIATSVNPTITTGSSLPAGTVGTPYTTTLAANGGTLPYTWSITTGSLPSGLSLVASSGAITGTPTVPTTGNFTAKVSDHNNKTATQSFSLSVTSVVSVAKIIGLSGNLAFGSVTTGTTATATLTITNSGNATLTVTNITYPTDFSGAYSGTIPAGGSHNVVVTFAPPAAGVFSGLVTAHTDATSGTATINASGTGITNATAAATFSKTSFKVNFSQANKDSAAVTVTLDLGANFNLTGQTAVVSIGGAQLSFPLSTKGSGVNASSSFKLKAPKAPSTIWTATIAYKNGTWAANWAAYGLANATIGKPGTMVVVPVEVDLNGQVFTGNSPTMVYTAKAGKSGSAK